MGITAEKNTAILSTQHQTVIYELWVTDSLPPDSTAHESRCWRGWGTRREQKTTTTETNFKDQISLTPQQQPQQLQNSLPISINTFLDALLQSSHLNSSLTFKSKLNFSEGQRRNMTGGPDKINSQLTLPQAHKLNGKMDELYLHEEVIHYPVKRPETQFCRFS